MPLTGTLEQFGSEDTWRARYQQEVVNVLESGGGDILGVPIPIPLPLKEIAASQADAIKERIGQEDEPFPIMTGGFYGAVEAIDKMLPPGPNSGIQDPTIPIAPILPIFLDILVEIGIPDPITWIIDHLEAFVELPWGKLAECKNKEFAEALAEIDPTINTDGLPDKLDAVCGFELPEINVSFPPKIELPTFDFSFAIDIDLPTFDPFLNLDFEFPALNWLPIQIMLGIIDAVIELIEIIAELALALIKGIVNFLIKIVEIVINAILTAIAFILAILGGSILLVACVIAFIKLIVIAFATAFVGFMVNKGVISFGAGGLLGLE